MHSNLLQPPHSDSIHLPNISDSDNIKKDITFEGENPENMSKCS